MYKYTLSTYTLSTDTLSTYILYTFENIGFDKISVNMHVCYPTGLWAAHAAKNQTYFSWTQDEPLYTIIALSRNSYQANYGV